MKPKGDHRCECYIEQSKLVQCSVGEKSGPFVFAKGVKVSEEKDDFWKVEQFDSINIRAAVRAYHLYIKRGLAICHLIHQVNRRSDGCSQ